jgi:hypothetical protein
MDSLTSTFSAASADLLLPHVGQDSAPSGSARLSRMPAACSPSDSPACQTSETCEAEQTSLGFLDALTCSPGAFRASRGPLPGSSEAQAITVTSGRQCATLSKQSGPLGSLVRMCLASSAWGSSLCVLTWKSSVTPRNRLLFQLAPSMPDTGETEFGLWPTPEATAISVFGKHDVVYQTAGKPRRITKGGTDASLGLARLVQLWPTPSVCGNYNRKGASEKSGDGLATAVKFWPTPTAMTNTGGAALCKWGGAGARAKLRTMVSEQELNGALNPLWVEWLMGYPIGHTACADSATRSSRKSRNVSSGSSRKSKGSK